MKHSLSLRQWRWLLLTLLLLAGAVITLLPVAVQQATLSWLREQGVKDAAIDDVDINLFTGTITVRGFRAGDHFRWQSLVLRMDWLPLIERRIAVRSMQLTGADFDLQQARESGALSIGELALPATGGAPAQAAGKGAPAPGWQLLVERVDIERIALAAHTRAAKFDANLASLTMRRRQLAADGVQQLESEAVIDRLSLTTATHQLYLGRFYWAGNITLPPLQRIEQLAIDGGEVILEKLKLGDGAGKPLASLQRLRATGIAVDGRRRLAAGTITLSQLEASLEKRQLAVAAVTIGGVDLSLPEGRASPLLKIDTIDMADGSRLSLHDASVFPPFHLELDSKGAAIRALDTSGSGEGTIKAGFAMSGGGSLDMEGSFRLPPATAKVDMQVTMKRLDLSGLSGYLEEDFGQAIQTGQLDLQSRLAIADGNIDAENGLTIRLLTLKMSDQPGRAAQKLGMPLDTALDMLRDSRGDIALKVPVKGRLDDPDVDLSDAINQALMAAMRSAALRYASMMLQPYGSLLPAISIAGSALKEAAKPRLTPVAFAGRSAALDTDGAAYAEKIAELLKQRSLRLQLCGIAARNEAADGGAPLTDEALLQIAGNRAQAVRERIAARGIDQERLFNCRPAIDEKPEGKGRVELLLD